MKGVGDHLSPRDRRRFAFLLLVVVAAAAVAASEPLHRFVRTAIDFAEPMIGRHALAGAGAFLVLSALSAMVVFFSTAVVTPVAVDAFGPAAALLLLWMGWVLGGVTTYAIGRFLGRRVVGWFIDPVRLREYEERGRNLATFRHVLVFQLAVPSEIPGYVLGLAGCPFRTFVGAMALAELPFAIGAVYLGEVFLSRHYLLLLGVGVAGVALSWVAFRHFATTWSHASSIRDAERTKGAAS